MKAALRTTAATAVLFLASVGGAGAAAGQTTGCDDASGYVPGGVCAIEVETSAFCPEGKPSLAYTVTTEGGSDTVDVTWLMSSGSDVVLNDLPLQGTLAWPAGNPAQVQVQFDVDGVTAVNTVAAPECVPSSGGPGGTGTGNVPTAGEALAETGATATPLLAVAGGLVVAGAVAVGAARARRASSTS
jgi:hypothetical protein